MRNYMKYWARNGEWNWICNREEYNGGLQNSGYPDFVEITKTFDVTGYWDSYDGNVNGHVADGVTGNVYGWYGDWIDETQKKAG